MVRAADFVRKRAYPANVSGDLTASSAAPAKLALSVDVANAGAMKVSSGPTPQVIFAARGGASKTRCAPVLDSNARAELTRCLLRDVLRASRSYDMWLVTPTPDLAAIARAHGAKVIPDPAVGGLNGAYEHAMAVAVTAVPDAPIALLPSDLGLLRRGDLSAAFDVLAGHDAALAPTQHGGTGAIFLAPGITIAPAFGPDSFVRHHTAMRAAGLKIAVLDRPGLTRDIDAPEDLAVLVRERANSWAVAFAGRRLASSKICVAARRA